MSDKGDLYRQLRAQVEPDALVALLRDKTHGGDTCYHNYRWTRHFLKERAPGSNPAEVERLLAALGCNCDCEVIFNLGPQIAQYEKEA